MLIATFNILHGQPLSRNSERHGPARHGGWRPYLSRREASSRAETHPIALPMFTDITPLRDAVRALDADVLGLQEVDVHQARSGGHHQVREIAEALDAPYWRFVPTVRGTPGARSTFEPANEADRAVAAATDDDVGPRYGIGLVSRLPVRQWHVKTFVASRIPLPLLVVTKDRSRILKVADEPRAAIAAVIDIGGQPVTVATVHLSFVPGRNIRQLRALRMWLATMPRPLILLGDFNLPGAIPKLITRYDRLISQPTFPSYRPRIQLDHILTDGLGAPATAAMRRSSRVLQLGVSDHCAVAVEFAHRPNE